MAIPERVPISYEPDYRTSSSEEERASIDTAEARLADWLATLPGRVFGDIKVKLFHVDFEGHTFGLVDRTEDLSRAGGQVECCGPGPATCSGFPADG